MKQAQMTDVGGHTSNKLYSTHNISDPISLVANAKFAWIQKP